MKALSPEQVNKINKKSLAEKHNVSRWYVSMILRGYRRANTEKAQLILSDAHNILKIVEG